MWIRASPDGERTPLDDTGGTALSAEVTCRSSYMNDPRPSWDAESHRPAQRPRASETVALRRGHSWSPGNS